MKLTFKRTRRQIQAVKLLASIAIHIMLYGGSRSGKTFIAIRTIIIRASKVRSRHCILRLNFNHVKTSIWFDTLPKVIALCFPELKLAWENRSKTDYYFTLPNGSEIWIGGLDDEKRVEKILGKEYSTIFFNECSQIPYSSIQVALTRLAEKNSLRKRAIYDENPPSKKHWSYWLFIKGVNPDDSEPIEDHDDYASLLMNPKDNKENIDAGYLKMLRSLPKDKRDRFEKGLFNDDGDGLAYYSFNREDHVKKVNRVAGGLMLGFDFNVDPMTAVVGQFVDNKFHIVSELFKRNSDTFKASSELVKRKLVGDVYPDSTGKNRKTSGISDHEILRQNGFVVKQTRNPFVTDRVNNINRLFQENRIIIDPSCKKLINDLEKVSWKDNSLDQKSDKLLTHISDSLGYLCWAIEPLREIRQSTFTRGNAYGNSRIH